MGIPSALIATDKFTDVCDAMADMGGIPDMEWITVDHPLGSTNDEELRQRAKSAAAQFVAIVTGRG